MENLNNSEPHLAAIATVTGTVGQLVDLDEAICTHEI